VPDPGLPKTRLAKIPRGMVPKIANGEDYPMPATIDDSAVLEDIEKVLTRVERA
jgi:propionyl-CoA synthetase